MDKAIKLTLEQDFHLRSFADQVQRMSREQAQALLIEQHRFMLIQKTMFQEILKHEWNLDVDLASL